MQTAVEVVVFACNRNEVLELLPVFIRLVTQHLCLPLDEGNRSLSGAVRNTQSLQQLRVAREIVAVPVQVVCDFGLEMLIVVRHIAHRLITPSKTVSAGPVIQTGSPSPAQLITSSPPFSSAVTS